MYVIYTLILLTLKLAIFRLYAVDIFFIFLKWSVSKEFYFRLNIICDAMDN